jgi:hypothetical protein
MVNVQMVLTRIVSGSYWHPLKNRSGQIVGINVAAEEITERKRIESDLAASQEELRSINVALAERVAVQAQERDRIWNLAQDLFVVSDSSGSPPLVPQVKVPNRNRP